MRVLLFALALAAAADCRAQATALPPGTSVDDTSSTKAINPLNEAEAKLDAEDYPGALRLLLPYLLAHPADARARYDLGYAEDAEGNAQGAEEDYRKAAAADPEQFEAHASLGLLLARAGRGADAVPELEAAAKLTPKPPNPEAQAQANRALARIEEPSHPEEARTALVAALRQGHETTADTLLAGRIAGRLGDSDAAAAAYGRVLNEAPAKSGERAEAGGGLAGLLIAEKRWGGAESVLKKTLADDPANPALNAQLAQTLSAQGKQNEAVAALEKVHAASPEDANVSAMLADLYTQSGAAAKAEPLYAQALQAHPHDPALLAGQGDALIREGKPEAALPLLEEATRLDATDGNAWGSLAFAASAVHRPQEVLDALAMQSKVMPPTAASYFLSATAYDTLHLSKRAVELYRQFLQAAGNGYPDEVWQARHRLTALAK